MTGLGCRVQKGSGGVSSRRGLREGDMQKYGWEQPGGECKEGARQMAEGASASLSSPQRSPPLNSEKSVSMTS